MGVGHYNNWEAWQVPPCSRFTTFHVAGFPYDDMFRGPLWSHIHASARFYEGLALPAAFTVHPAPFPAGILLATTVNPNLPTDNATAPNVRWWMAH